MGGYNRPLRYCDHAGGNPGEGGVVGLDRWGTLVGVAKFIGNPGYDGNKDDIALVKLDRPVQTRPIPLARSAGEPGTVYRTSGWGFTCDTNVLDPACAGMSQTLQTLSVKRLPGTACALADPTTGQNMFVAETMLYIVSANGQPAMACFGDSGGPVLRWSHGIWLVVGLDVGDGDDLSLRAHLCSTAPDGGPGKGVATNVTQYLAWMLRTLIGCGDAMAARLVASLYNSAV